MNSGNASLSHSDHSGRGVSFGVVAALAAFGVAAALTRPGHGAKADRVARFRAYLADHLTGSDAAFAVVKRLRASHHASAEGRLFERLYHEFSEERVVVRTLLQSLGGSPFKLKRLIGQAAGSALQVAAGGEPGDLALFRTLESLSVGVQGKRCLWRVAQGLEPWLQAPGDKSFHALEMQAVDQWNRIEQRRLALATQTFAE